MDSLSWNSKRYYNYYYGLPISGQHLLHLHNINILPVHRELEFISELNYYDLAQNLLECSQVLSVTTVLLFIPISHKVRYFGLALVCGFFLAQLCLILMVVLASLLSAETWWWPYGRKVPTDLSRVDAVCWSEESSSSANETALINFGNLATPKVQSRITFAYLWQEVYLH